MHQQSGKPKYTLGCWLGLGGIIIIIPLIFILVLAIFSSLSGKGFSLIGSQTSQSAKLNSFCREIPEPQKSILARASDKWKVRIELLAAVGETENSILEKDIQGPWASSRPGARGPFQFMPTTWSGKPDVGFLTNPLEIKKNNGKGQDGDNDGKAEVDNLADAAMAAAYVLAMNQAGGNITPDSQLGKTRITNALSLYNSGKKWDEGGSQITETRQYVDKIFQLYNRFSCWDKTIKLALPLGENTRHAETNRTFHTVSANGHGLFVSHHNGKNKTGDGIDLIVAPTIKYQPIYAVSDAQVEQISEYHSPAYGYGGWNIYLYNQEKKIEALYAHVLPRADLTENQFVSRGEQIGWIYPHDRASQEKIKQANNSFPKTFPPLGFSTRSHLHFQLWIHQAGMPQTWMEKQFGISNAH